jgi:DNA-binding CsgD family transcriptional regulator
MRAGDTKAVIAVLLPGGEGPPLAELVERFKSITLLEKTVLRYKIMGLRSKATAAEMGLSVSYVDEIVANCRDRVGAASKEQLCYWAGRVGF